MNNNLDLIYKNSLIEKKFKYYLENEDIDTISFDIFDTLVYRTVSHPLDIFYKMGKCKYIMDLYNDPYTFQTYREKAETKARKLSSKEDITLCEIYDQMDLTNEQKETIKQIEIQEEDNSLYVNKQVEGWIQKALNQNKKVILISDMYLSKSIIDKIIIKKLNSQNFDIFMSSEYGVTKSKKSLYKLIQEKNNIDFDSWLHIGDNIVSDIQNAKALGIKTIHYNVSKPIHELLQLERAYIQEDLGAIDNIRKVAAIQNPFENEKESFFYCFGSLVLGPLLFQFSVWLKNIIQKYDIQEVLFIMREGKTFERYFRKVCPEVSTKLVYASRKSTYLASLDKNFSLQDLNLHYYRKLTIKDCFNLFKIKNTNELLLDNEECTIEDANKVYIEKKSLMDIFIEVFSSLQKQIRKNIKNEKKVFCQYLNELNVKNNALVVDLGGNGTLPMRITNVLQDKVKLNTLFYMHEVGYSHTLASKTFSFLPFNKKVKNITEIVRRTPEFIENLLNGMEETTIEYTKKDGKVEVLRAFPHDMTKGLREKIESTYLGVDNFFSLMKESSEKEAINRNQMALVLARCIDVPSSIEAKFLGELVHDEGRGSSSYEQLVTEEKVNKIRELGLDYVFKNYSKNLYFKRNDFHWIQGVITQLDSTYLPTMKGIRLTNNNNDAMDNIIDTLDTNSYIKKVFVYGSGEFFKELKPHLDERRIEVISIFDSKAKMSEYKVMGYSVASLEKIISFKEKYPILITSKAFSADITDKIFKFGIEENLELEVINYTDGLIKIEKSTGI